MNNLKSDVVIIGAGIAGIWLTNLLKNAGFSSILLEKNAIGSNQTINSQGMLHSGVKYSLQGTLTGDTKAIKNAPFLWQQALSNKLAVKLTENCILSNYQYLWSTGNLATKVANFFVSKLLQSSVSALSGNQFTEPFNNSMFKGHLYKLHETVLNMAITLQELFNPIADHTIKIDDVEFKLAANDKSIDHCLIKVNGENFSLSAKHYIFTSGEGAKQFLELFNNAPKMQLRPLNMVAVKTRSLPNLFGHNIGLQQLPTITVSTHRTPDNNMVWLCGGKIAEDGVDKSSSEQIDCFKEVLAQIFPWLNFKTPEHSWGSFIINRAENLRLDGKKPTHATWFPINNAIFAWPTKLVLAPMMSEEITNYIKSITNDNNINTNLKNYLNNNFTIDNRLSKEQPIDHPVPNNKDWELLKNLPKPRIASPWWDNI